MAAYSSLALLDAHKNFFTTIIKLRRQTDTNSCVIKEYHDSYDELTKMMDCFVETAPFKIHYLELKTFLNQELHLDDNNNISNISVLQKKLGNIKVYNILQKMEADIIQFVKDVKSPYKMN
jgi:hypothetical protein